MEEDDSNERGDVMVNSPWKNQLEKNEDEKGGSFIHLNSVIIPFFQIQIVSELNDERNDGEE